MMKRQSNRYLIGALFIVAGVNHFVAPRMYMSIMPDYLPRPRLLVLLSGVAEVIGGLLALFSQTQRLARGSLTALLIAVFPANLHMAVHAEQFAKIPAWLLWARLPLQGVLIGWVWWATGQSGQTDKAS
jgi:uncharacterized membrane protein